MEPSGHSDTVPIRVLVVEDDVRFAAELTALLKADGGFSTPVIAASLANAREHLTAARFDIVVIDIALPDGSGIELLATDVGDARRIVVTVNGAEDTVVAAIAAGADGYVLKDDGQLVASLRAILRGTTPLSPTIAGYLLDRIRRASSPPVASPLSPRETQILRLLATGNTQVEIAAALGLSRHTIGDHVKSIYRKLAVGSSAAAVNAGFRAGILRLGETD